MALSPPGPTAPGSYAGSGQAVLLRANENQWLFQQQIVATNKSGVNGANASASIAVLLERIKASNFYPFGASVQIYFTDVNQAAADPGAFEIDVQTSDIDVDAQYSNISALTGGLNAAFSGRVELPTFWAKFLRVYAKTITNAVYLNVLVTR
jgi:hypothetical protein